MLLSEAIDAISKLLDCWPNGRSAAQGGYIGNLSGVLCQYPRMVALECTNPLNLNGLVRETRFLPTPADVIGWCERRTEELRAIVERDDRVKATLEARQEDEEQQRKLAEQRKLRPTLKQMQETYGDKWGINQLSEEMRERKQSHGERLERANKIQFERECRAFGADPDKGVSPSLVRIMLEKQRGRRITDAELRVYFAPKAEPAE